MSDTSLAQESRRLGTVTSRRLLTTGSIHTLQRCSGNLSHGTRYLKSPALTAAGFQVCRPPRVPLKVTRMGQPCSSPRLWAIFNTQVQGCLYCVVQSREPCPALDHQRIPACTHRHMPLPHADSQALLKNRGNITNNCAGLL